MDRDYCDLVEECVKKSKEMADAYIKKHIDPIADMGNPERIIGKPYKMWSEQDKQMLRQAYVYSPEELEEFIAKQEVDAVWSIQDINKRLGV